MGWVYFVFNLRLGVGEMGRLMYFVHDGGWTVKCMYISSKHPSNGASGGLTIFNKVLEATSPRSA